jgi:phosphatidylserine/phosphatidylglycerophosphate/cardiolipin synthase-like enzyme
LERFGVKVRRQKHLKLHAKLLITDGARAQVGSMNIDRSAFDLRRELGIVVVEPHIIKGLRKVFERDWKESKPYEAPDPLEPDSITRASCHTTRISCMSEPARADRETPVVTLPGLALCFLQIALSSFGGGLSA